MRLTDFKLQPGRVRLVSIGAALWLWWSMALLSAGQSPPPPAPQAVITVQVELSAAMAGLRVRSILTAGAAPADQAILNMQDMAPYAVIPADVLQREEEAQKARALADKTKKTSPDLKLPIDIRRPSPAAAEVPVAPAGPAGDPPAAPVQREFSGTVPAGKYHLCLKVGDDLVTWAPNLDLGAGAVVQAVKIESPGAVRVTWAIDQPLHTTLAVGLAEPTTLADLSTRLHHVTQAGLLRDGHVWANARRLSDTEFLMPAVPPGTYTLVLQNTYERFLCVEANVTVAAGQETAVALKPRRADQGGLAVAYYDPTRNKYEPLHAWGRVYDTQLGLAFTPTSTVHKSDTQGGLPQEYDLAEYGSLLVNGHYKIECDEPRFRAINQPLSAGRLPPQANRPVKAVDGAPPELPPEEYKPAIIRLQPVSAIAAKSATDSHFPRRFELPAAAAH